MGDVVEVIYIEELFRSVKIKIATQSRTRTESYVLDGGNQGCSPVQTQIETIKTGRLIFTNFMDQRSDWL